MGLETEHYYTGVGRQRAVFLGPDSGRFLLEVNEGDAAGIEVSFDPVAVVKAGRALWEVFDGGPAGEVAGATALRVDVRRVTGWVKLNVIRFS